jgi:hypothetical protein
MELEDDINEINNINETDDINETEYELDIEDQLDNLKNLGNEEQLAVLQKEITHIIIHEITPSDGWYDERFPYIDMYSKLDWSGLANYFQNKNDYIYERSTYIIRLLNELIDDRATKPNFHIRTYYRTISEIYSLWKYYKEGFTDEGEDDSDILDLIDSMNCL